MEYGQISHKIAELIIDELKVEDLTPEGFGHEMDLVDEMGIDSMDLATIALIIRDVFDIIIDEDDYQDLTTLKKITDYVIAKLGAKS